MGSEAQSEMVQALRTAYTDQAKEMPDHVKKLVDKYEHKNTEQLRKEMHRTTDTISQARKLLHQLQDAQVTHRKSWLKHLTSLMTTLGKQMEAFETQQKDYQERILRSRREIHISRRNLQRLNAQASETTIPEVPIEDEEPTELSLQDAEESELRHQVSKVLKKCFQISTDKEAIEIGSDEEDDMDITIQTLKRPRSREPGFGGAAS